MDPDIPKISVVVVLNSLNQENSTEKIILSIIVIIRETKAELAGAVPLVAYSAPMPLYGWISRRGGEEAERE